MIRIGIAGYGNLARGVEAAVMNAPDMELKAVFTRRDPGSVRIADPNAAVYSYGELKNFRNELDVVVNCGGSATDLPRTTPEIAADFNVIDSFDTHAAIPEHFDRVDRAAAGGKLAIISVGWDPGLFSVSRLYGNAVLPRGKDYTFWGRGVSQGHSDAVRRIKGVVDARQYTVPVQESLDAVRRGEDPELSVRQKHVRECYVVAEDGADLAAIEHEIKTMPNYFADYDTTVTFIDAEEMKKNHSALPHGGSVIRSGMTGAGTRQTIEYKLTLGSNPEFTGSVLAAFARAAYRLSEKGETGCRTVFDIPPAALSEMSGAELRAHLL